MFRSAALLITFFLVSSLYAQEQLLSFRHHHQSDERSSIFSNSIEDFWGNTIQENQKIDRGAMEFKSTLN